MIPVILPSNRRLVFYLAAEEYFSAHVGDVTAQFSANSMNEATLSSDAPCEHLGSSCASTDPQKAAAPEGIFFLWQTRPTVIFGRHQVMENEVNIPYCQENKVECYRRKTGGGCVYSDEGNLMLSYISPSKHSQEVFQEFLDSFCVALQRLGLPAVSSSHNDVLVNERKISGCASMVTSGGTIVHGTFLLASNVEALQKAITPSQEKLNKHGVASVRQRVVTLAELCEEMQIPPISTQEIKDHLIRHFCGHRLGYRPSDEEIKAIEAIEQTYLAPDFIKTPILD